MNRNVARPGRDPGRPLVGEVQPVDVLAVMRDATDDIAGQWGMERANPMHDARAAVAELVEADREYDRLRWAPYDRRDPVASRAAREQFIAAQDRRAAALARFGATP